MDNIKILTYCLIFYALLTIFTDVTDLKTGVYMAENNNPDVDVSAIDKIWNTMYNIGATLVDILFFSTNIAILNGVLWVIRIISIIELVFLTRSFFYV